MKRIEWIDYSKAIGIILVIIGHCYSCFLVDWIYSFHMPLFFMLSGLTFSVRKSPKEFTVSKIKSLLIPYLLYSVLRFMWVCLTDIKQYGFVLENIVQRVIGIILCIRDSRFSVGLWFLPLLFIAEEVVYCIIKYVRSRKLQAIIFVGGGIANLIIVSVYPIKLFWGIDIIFIVSMFIFIGMILRNVIDNLQKGKNAILIICALLAINFCAFYFNRKMLGMRVDIYYHHYGNLVLYLLSATSGAIATMLLSCKLRSAKVLLHIGRSTLHIYCLHHIFIDIIQILIGKMKLPSLFFENQIIITAINMIILVVCLFICMACITFARKTKSIATNA